MEKALEIQKKVQEILGTEEVYLVGGSVRDVVMGKTPKDYDFTTVLTPDEVEAKVKEAGRRVYNIGNGKKHGTVGFKVPYIEYNDYGGPENAGGFAPQWHSREAFEYVEVTTYRTETYDGTSRQPSVTFVTSLDEDLKRRDFTMNAMVLRTDGTIYDPFGGRLDIHAKQIKTVGQPKDRILEDPLRILRGARFAARYGFKIDPNFTGKARQLADRIYDVSVERWVQELDKLLTSDFVWEGMTELDKMGVLIRILPEIYNGDGEPLIRVPSDIEDPDEAWAYLLKMSQEHVLGMSKGARLTKYVNSGICARLKFSNDRTELILDKRKRKG